MHISQKKKKNQKNKDNLTTISNIQINSVPT